MAHIEDILLKMVSQRGDRYILGAEARASAANPNAFDCSELMEWSCNRSGVEFPDGAHWQLEFCRRHRTTIPVSTGMIIRGALLFRDFGAKGGGGAGNHVACSLGQVNGRLQVVEARGRKWGVGVWPSVGRQWTHAARIPGVDYGPRKVANGLPIMNFPLNVGDRGEDVKFMEYLLKTVTGKPKTVNHTFSADTRQAVLDFQRFAFPKQPREWDGVMGPKTWGVVVYFFGLKKKG